MDFDFFSVKLIAEAHSSDELIVGFFNGKKDSRLDFQFVAFPRRFKNLLNLETTDHLSEFREKMNVLYKSLMTRSNDVLMKSNEFIGHVKRMIQKKGGRSAFTKKISHMIEKNDRSNLYYELHEILNEWTSEVKLTFDYEATTYNELSEREAEKKNVDIDLDTASNLPESRQDLISTSDFYPIIDPMEGIKISNVKVGEPLYVSVIHFSDEEEQKKLQQAHPQSFDENGKNIKPLESYVIAREFLNEKNGTMLIKVLIDDWFVAKSIIMSNMRIRKIDKNYSLLGESGMKKEDGIQFKAATGNSTKNTEDDEEALFSKDRIIDLIMTGSILLLLAFIIIVVTLILF